LILKVDVEKVRRLGIVPKKLDSLIVPEMRLRVRSNGLEKKDLAMLDVLASADWERPLYVNNTSLAQFNIDLSRYVVQEGNAYRILPVFNPNPETELVNTDVAYENLMKKFQFRGLDNADVYYTQDYRSFVQNHRSSFYALAEALIEEGDDKRAAEVLTYCLQKMPDRGVRYDFTNARMVQLLFEVGEKEKALEIVNILAPRLDETAAYFLKNRSYGRELQINIIMLGELYKILYAYGESDLGKKLEDMYNQHADMFQNKEINRKDF
jgi:hypothetical protein